LDLQLERKSPPSVLHINYRSLYEDKYPAKFDEDVVRLMIRLYSEENDLVLDSTAGSGVMPIEAVKLNRNAIAIDINPVAIDLIQKKYEVVREHYKLYGELKVYTHDSRKEFPIEANVVDLIMQSPPFGLSIDAKHDKYSTNPDDIANVKTYKEWRYGFKKIMLNNLHVLKPGKLMIVEIRPRAKKGHSFPLFAWIVQDAEELGFEFYAEYIQVVQPYMMWTMGDKLARKPFPTHSYLLIFRKKIDTDLAEYNENKTTTRKGRREPVENIRKNHENGSNSYMRTRIICL